MLQFMLLLNVTTVTKIVNGGALTIQSLSLFISLLSSLHLVEYYPESLLVLENLIVNILISSNHCHLGHVPLVTCGDVHESVPHFRSKCLFIVMPLHVMPESCPQQSREPVGTRTFWVGGK